jgi:hypothetical protein
MNDVKTSSKSSIYSNIYFYKVSNEFWVIVMIYTKPRRHTTVRRIIVFPDATSSFLECSRICFLQVGFASEAIRWSIRQHNSRQKDYANSEFQFETRQKEYANSQNVNRYGGGEGGARGFGIPNLSSERAKKNTPIHGTLTTP